MSKDWTGNPFKDKITVDLHVWRALLLILFTTIGVFASFHWLTDVITAIFTN